MCLRETYLPLISQFLRRDPLAVAHYLTGGKAALVRRAMRQVLGRDDSWAVDELGSAQGELREVLIRTTKLPFLGWVHCAEILYALVRVVKPRIIVETGVAAGVSSSFLLAALARNGEGELHSIDLPDHEEAYFPTLGKKPIAVLPPGESVGFLIPEALRSRWHLHQGNTRVLLPSVLDSLGNIDIFLHDSEHTYEMMMFEFETVWPHLRPGGLLLSDDVDWNDSFPDFCHRRGVRPVYFWSTGLAGGIRRS